MALIWPVLLESRHREQTNVEACHTWQASLQLIDLESQISISEWKRKSAPEDSVNSEIYTVTVTSAIHGF